MDLGEMPARPGFENLPRRWVAERNFAWISHNRRMAKDYEWLCQRVRLPSSGYDAARGEEAGPCLTIFRRSRKLRLLPLEEQLI